ncbi:hypothetical protein GCM10027258_22230 [Amycolatopsis stemonae]
MLALADLLDPGEAETAGGAERGLSLRVEDFGLRHDVDNDSGHGRLLLIHAGRGYPASIVHPVREAAGT